jgi:HEAT repeat protein
LVVRKAAIKVVGQMPVTPEILEALVPILQDDYSLRDEAVKVLGTLVAVSITPEIKARVMALLNHENFYVRETAADVLSKMPISQDILEVFAAMLQHPHWMERAIADRVLRKTPGIKDAVLALLSHEDPEEGAPEPSAKRLCS